MYMYIPICRNANNDLYSQLGQLSNCINLILNYLKALYIILCFVIYKVALICLFCKYQDLARKQSAWNLCLIYRKTVIIVISLAFRETIRMTFGVCVCMCVCVFFGKGKGGPTPHMHGHKESYKDLNLKILTSEWDSNPRPHEY